MVLWNKMTSTNGDTVSGVRNSEPSSTVPASRAGQRRFSFSASETLNDADSFHTGRPSASRSPNDDIVLTSLNEVQLARYDCAWGYSDPYRGGCSLGIHSCGRLARADCMSPSCS